MKRFILLTTVIILVSSCKKNKEVNSLQWLIGKWERTNNSDTTKTTYEIWNKNLSGTSITIKDGDTIFIENFSIVKTEDKKYLQISGMNGQPSFFEFTNENDNSFTCVNPQNQFPKKISYNLENNQLHSKVENNDFSVDFLFKKI